MGTDARDAAFRFADLPLLTSRRACLLADCSRTTLQRTGPAPVGRRGRTFVYRTDDIIAWLTAGAPRGSTVVAPAAQKRTIRGSGDALARLRSIARGA